MANYESTKLIVQMKALARTESMPLDASSVWDSYQEAQTYIKAANAYGGQIISAKMEDGNYKAFILNPGDGGYTLTPLGADASSVKQYVIIGTRPESGQEQGVIYIENNVGYIWNGSGWQKIFSDVSTDIEDLKSRVSTIENDIDLKAPLVSPTFTGTVTVEGNAVATQTWVNSLIGQLNNGVPGIVDDGENPLPVNGYKAGQMWRVAVEGTYAGQECEVGDLIICLKDYTDGTSGNSDFMVVQANIDGAVTGSESSTDGHIVVFNGATGKVIKDSEVSIASLTDAIAKAHEHANKTQLDTFTKTETELLSAAHDDATSQISTVKTELEESISEKADVSAVYTKTDIDSKISTIEQNLNTKVDGSTVDSKIASAKTDILEEAATAASTALEERIGDIPEDTDLKTYVDNSIGSGGTSSAEAIAQAKQEAIEASQEYTDNALTITEF